MSSKLKCIYDPLVELMSYYSSDKTEKKAKIIDDNIPVEQLLKGRIIDGNRIGIEKDLDKALKKYSALDIINNILLDGMKTVGDLFGSGQMQLPFVLQSAECMKVCVRYLEPFMEKSESGTAKGTMVLATVKGDVHDIGKNLVDIILTNNGYKVLNMGIKCPLDRMIEAYDEHKADVIGMSGLLVKSTAIMKENLEILNERNYEIPVILGGAALNRRFVEGELRKLFNGDVYYANDAFDGLRFMGEVMEHKKRGIRPKLQLYKDPRSKERRGENNKEDAEFYKESSVRSDVILPEAPFLGCKIVENIQLDKVYEYINEIALFRGSWNIYKDRNKPDSEYDNLIKTEIYPRFNELKLKAKREKLLVPKVIYGYYPCNSEKNDLIIYKPKSLSGESLFDVWNGIDAKNIKTNNLVEWIRIKFPRQRKDKHLCISDFFRGKDSGITDIIAIQIVTVGAQATEYAQKLYEENKYQDYLYFHGLSVETAEALAEYWHKIVRKELKIDKNDSKEMQKLFQQGYMGSRYSFGYPACPDLEDNKYIFEILKPERIGITLTEEWQMVPEQSTNAIIVHHPEAKYFFIK